MITAIIITTIILLLLACFIITILFIYQKKQLVYYNNLEEVKMNFEKTLLATNLEIKEETFQNISREIHDNISLSLTLAKLHLHTLDWQNISQATEKVDSTIQIIGKVITDLSDISKGLNQDVIIQQGLIKALEYECNRINQIEFLKLELITTGSPCYLDGKMELIIFRIVQEAFSNIIKHSKSNTGQIFLNYNYENLLIEIRDNGIGFNLSEKKLNCRNSGLRNMESRIKMLQGNMHIDSKKNKGTCLTFIIPIKQNGNN